MPPVMPPPIDPWLWGTIAMDVAMASHASRDALEERRRQRLRRLLAWARERSPFYGRVLRNHDVDRVRLEDLPVARKCELMSHFDQWVTDPAIRLDGLCRFVSDASRIAEPFLGRYLAWESSGSSGEPGVFVQDDLALAVCDALDAVRGPMSRAMRQLFGPWAWGGQIAFVGATNGHFASTVSIERLRRLNPVLWQRLRCISFMQPTEAIVRDIDALAPTVIATYPSAAVLLAEERLAGRMRTALREVWTGGEDLSPAKRDFIRRAFDCRLINSYGASEFLSLAFECERGAMHLNSDWAILESVDDRGRAVPAGEAGATVLLTNLSNHVQPIIRYDLGDRIVVHADPCACGCHLPVIEVQGRCEDTLCLGSERAGSVKVLPLALSTAIEEGAGLFDFQLVQKGPCDLLLCTGSRSADAELALRRAQRVLGEFLRSQGATDVRIECRCGEPGRVGRSGKVSRVVGAPAPSFSGS
ncbi:Phenylacetate-coenzyme A ligase PaaK, adenylate-forming domain family [Variovorax sp. HW608]|uniref:phenylacetate--CoA ligase family protein n=1 Tax=Variovorax sp. HW608 TaxID=1034889 RepID=UPI00081FEB85|nr:AMP-binding protein [Variovorax sp. HW608]SCK28043.1 Phenylacetate-coenzyme A ligase PaaK, adenylate-forming domain family [Variovorax sp. HW608]